MRAVLRRLPDSRRIHLSDGPIDLVIEAFGEGRAVRAAHEAACRRFLTILDELCAELPLLRRPAGAEMPEGAVARRMWRAARPFADDAFITPMAAVAGAVADEVLAAMNAAAELDRAYVNNGGDIAIHLRPPPSSRSPRREWNDGRSRFRRASLAPRSPPPCGEGLGVGVGEAWRRTDETPSCGGRPPLTPRLLRREPAKPRQPPPPTPSPQGGGERRAPSVHASPGESLVVGLVDRPDAPALFGRALLHAESPVRGIATSGWRGRSFSLGVADAVTVLARTAAEADAAATLIANAVDLPGHPAVLRVPAAELAPDSDLGDRLVTRAVGPLAGSEIGRALDAGAAAGRRFLDRGLLVSAALHLAGETRVLGVLPALASPEPRHAIG